MEPLKNNESEIYQISTRSTEGVEIDVMDLLKLLWNNVVSIVLGACCVALLAYLYVSLAKVPTYTSSATMYVINSQNADASPTYADLQSSTHLIRDAQQLIYSDRVLKKTIENLGLENVTADQVRGNMSVAIQGETRFLEVVVVNTDPYRAADLANMICEVSCEALKDILNINMAKVVDVAEVPGAPSGPNVKGFVLGGGFLGAFIMIVFVMIRYLMDDTLKTTDDIEKHLGLSVLGNIPELESLVEQQSEKKKNHGK